MDTSHAYTIFLTSIDFKAYLIFWIFSYLRKLHTISKQLPSFNKELLVKLGSEILSDINKVSYLNFI